MNPRKIYAVLAVTFAASLAAAALFHFFPVSIVGDLAGIPAILALFGALFQLSRDSIAHGRSLRSEEAKNRFTIGATSHMANIAFDKHVSFCEEYTEQILETLTFLFRKGPHKDVLERANSLADTRTKWTLWLTPEVDAELLKFEGALRTIGAQAELLENLHVGEDRSDTVQKVYETFAEVMGFETWKGQAVSGDRAIEKVFERLRKVLGIDELTHLRGELVKRALDDLKSS
jgi:hypothetical protein